MFFCLSCQIHNFSLHSIFLKKSWKSLTKTLSRTKMTRWLNPRKSHWRERLSTVDLLVLTGLDQFCFLLKVLYAFLHNKQPSWGGQLYWAFHSSQLAFPDESLVNHNWLNNQIPKIHFLQLVGIQPVGNLSLGYQSLRHKNFN